MLDYSSGPCRPGHLAWCPLRLPGAQVFYLRHLLGEYPFPHPPMIAVPQSLVDALDQTLSSHSGRGPQADNFKPTKGHRT